MKPVKKNPKTPPGGAPSGSLPPQPQGKEAGDSSPVFNIPVDFLGGSPTEAQMQISRMVRSGSCETPRLHAGGKGIGCPARMFRSILPAPPRRHVSSRASEDGILAAQPRGGLPGGPGTRHAGAGARTPGRLWSSRPCGQLPSTPHAQSRLPVRAPVAARRSSDFGGAVLMLPVGSRLCE
jgi:hypothetical protein